MSVVVVVVVVVGVGAVVVVVVVVVGVAASAGGDRLEHLRPLHALGEPLDGVAPPPRRGSL